MPAGRIAKPAALRLLSGRSDGRDSGGRVVVPPPAFVRRPPSPPTWLDREAAAEWRRVAPGLERLKLLKPEDRAALGACCTEWSAYVAATKSWHASGMVVDGRVSPAFKAAAVALGNWLRLAVQFGLTPSSEQNLATPAPAAATDDPFAATGS